MRLMTTVGQPDGPRRVFDAWESGLISDADLRGLLADTWLRIDEPEHTIGAAAWMTMFRAAGFISQPTNIQAPTQTLTVYRGATEVRRLGMAWSLSIDTAGHFQLRHARFGSAFLYTAVVEPIGVMALFGNRIEQEVVVDPELLVDVRTCG